MVVLPIIHPNGTSKEELLDLRAAACAALNAAAAALKRLAPNARDYYPEPGRLEQAVEQHIRRVHVLRDLMAEIKAECQGIDGF